MSLQTKLPSKKKLQRIEYSPLKAMVLKLNLDFTVSCLSCIVSALFVKFRPTFEDEITKDLKHTGAGILSMANR